MQQHITEYFDAFNRHSLDALSILFSEKVSLCDWEQSVIGLEAVMEINRRTFKKFPQIHVEIIRTNIVENIGFCELLLDLGNSKKLPIIDLIEVSEKKIVKISAYRRF